MALTWTAKPAITSGDWWGVKYMAGVLWAWEEVWSSSLAGPVVESNDDGLTWTAPAFINTSFRAYSMAWNGSNIIVVVGDGISGSTRSYARTAGVWANGTMPATSSLWHGVEWNGTTFCAVASGGGAATSVNGIAWTPRALAMGNFPTITANGATFLTVDQSNASVRRSVNHGVSWSTIAMPSSGWRGITSGGGVVVAVGWDKIAYSLTDGLTWTELPIIGNWLAIAWDGTQFCAIPSFGTLNYATSPDGITWTTGAIVNAADAPYMTANGANNFYYLRFNKMFQSAGAAPPPAVGSAFFHFTFPSA